MLKLNLQLFSNNNEDESPIDTQTPELKPTDQQTNTGSGIESAIGTEYSWDKEGLSQAQKQYNQDALKVKQDALKNRQNMEQNAVNYQQQADMMQYQNNQSADKVGWTGGYVLDQNKQMDYLKSSIQAQMYGAMELQKYGYDSGLAAARLSYDLNQKEYAHKYYMDAVTAALQEADRTGIYISAEAKDMMSQLGIADDKLKDYILEDGNIDTDAINNSIDPDVKKAYQIKSKIDSWFESNGISKAGIQTLQKIQYEEDLALRKQQLKWQQYAAAQQMFDSQTLNNPDLFIKTDEKGNPLINNDTGKFETGNWDTMTGTQILDYIQQKDADGNTKLNPDKANQFTSYVSTTLKGKVQVEFNKYCESHEAEVKQGTDVAFQNFIKNNDMVSSFLNTKFGSVSEEERKLLYKELDSISFFITAPDGTQGQYDIKINSDGTIGSEAKMNNKDIPTGGSTNESTKEGTSNSNSTLTFNNLADEIENADVRNNLKDIIKTADDSIMKQASKITDHAWFGNFWNTGKEGTKQYNYTKAILDAANSGTLKSPVVIDMNYGNGSQAYFLYNNGTFVKVSEYQGKEIMKNHGNLIINNAASDSNLKDAGIKKTW